MREHHLPRCLSLTTTSPGACALMLLLWASSTTTDASTLSGGPEFDYTTPTDVVIQLHKTVRLNCRVYGLDGYQVVWLKKAEDDPNKSSVGKSEVIAIGSNVVVKDDRYRLIHREGSLDWTLQIKQSRLSDEGIYECQVTTTPKTVYIIHLNIVEASAEIRGVNQVGNGATLTLKCEIKAIQSPHYIDWSLNNTLLLTKSAKVTIRTSKQQHTTLCTLTVREITYEYSGEYSCSAPDVAPTSHRVKVIQASRSNHLRGDQGSTNVAAPTVAVQCHLMRITAMLILMMVYAVTYSRRV